jgi:signal transduction histidine kinase
MADGFRILFVDDEETFLCSTVALLCREDFECDGAPDVDTALEMLARQIEGQTGLTVTVETQGEIVRLSPDLEVAAFRIVQQALDNVAAHARAKYAWVEIVFAAEMLNLIVRDDGIGFAPPDQPTDLARQGHFGLIGMYERALLYGGQNAITSSPGAGATIAARFPLPG